MSFAKSKILLIIFITGWGVASLAVISYLKFNHLVSFLPNASFASTASASWSMTHVLGTDCKCSLEVAHYLLKRGALNGVTENVVLIGKDFGKMSGDLTAKGFKVRLEDPEKLKEQGATGVPFLLIGSPRKEVAYAGGYANERVFRETQIHDIEILESLRGGRSPASFPIFGCAASLKYQKLIDPFGIKYK